MKWVTRRSARVNRIATAWFVRRFIDAEPVFLFVEPEQVAAVQDEQGATGFDAFGARYPHRDQHGRCSFEALVAEHRPGDGALRELARIVHCADFADEVQDVPEAAGLRAISRGFPLVARDDHDAVEKASFLYDALYAALQNRTGIAS
ncbi:MAG: chromate resistance protein ChrB domain-containing protein [Myxococcales bacterium]